MKKKFKKIKFLWHDKLFTNLEFVLATTFSDPALRIVNDFFDFLQFFLFRGGNYVYTSYPSYNMPILINIMAWQTIQRSKIFLSYDISRSWFQNRWDKDFNAGFLAILRPFFILKIGLFQRGKEVSTSYFSYKMSILINIMAWQPIQNS